MPAGRAPKEPAVAKEWYFQVMGSELGPVSSAELKHKVKLGQIQADTMVRAAPDGKWQTADRVKGLIDPPPAPPPAASKASPAAVESPAFDVTPVDKSEHIPLARSATASSPAERTYHVMGDAAVDVSPPDEPHSGDYDFFQFVGFEQALGTALHHVLLEHCRKHHLTLTQATRRALAEFLGRKDLLEDPAPETEADSDTSVGVG